jgi:hypothetical protein
MKLLIPKGKTSKSVDVFIQDSSQTDGRGLTGLVFNTSSLAAYYHRPGSAATAITLATLASATAAWSSGGFIAVDGTNMPGLYRLDIPDAVLASGVDEAVVMLRGAANMVPVVIEIQLTSMNVNDAVRAGLTALPNANAEAVGGSSRAAPVPARSIRTPTVASTPTSPPSARTRSRPTISSRTATARPRSRPTSRSSAEAPARLPAVAPRSTFRTSAALPARLRRVSRASTPCSGAAFSRTT